MHYCLRCHYALGPLPGVPADQFGEFTADVRCPECAFEIPKGARILVGSSTEADARPLTNRRRLRRVLVTFAKSTQFLLPLVFLGFMFAPNLKQFIAGLLVLNGIGALGLAARVIVLVWVVWWVAKTGFTIWAVWRKWTPVKGSNERSPASWDVRWLCAPGMLVVFSGDTTGTDARLIGAQPAGRASPDGAKVKLSWLKGRISGDYRVEVALPDGAKVKLSWLTGPISADYRVEAADICNIRVCILQDRWNRWRSGDRAVAQLIAGVYRRGYTGRRVVVWMSIYLDTKGEPGQPGRDRTSALIDAGDAIARLIRRTIGMAVTESNDGVAVADATDGHAGVSPLAVEGSLYAQQPWPAPCVGIITLFSFPLALSVAGVFASTILAVGSRLLAPIPIAAAPWLIWFDGVSWVVFAIMLALTLALPIWLIRRALRRELALCRWEVGTHGIRVTERHFTIKAKPTAEFTRDIPARHIAAIGPSPKNGRMRLIASDQVRRELASITLNTIPEGGAEAFAQRIRERVWGGDGGKPSDARGDERVA